MTVRPFKDGKHFMIDFRYDTFDGRKRHRELCPTPGKRAAQDFEVKRRRELEEEAARAREEVKIATPTFGTFAEEFMKSYAKANNAPSEQRAKRSILNKHLLPRFGQHRLDQIGNREIERMKADLVPTHAPATINNVCVVLRKILNYASESGLLDKVPHVRRMKVPPQAFAFLGFEEYAQLLEAVQGDAELLVGVLLAGDAGLRRGELAGLKWQDINFNLNRICVSRSIDLGGYDREEKAPKGGRSRTVPLTSRLRAALKAHRHLAPHVLIADCQPWTPEVFNVQGARAYRLASLPQPERPWHALRHTFGSHLAMKGAPARAIQELMGHASITTTMGYMHLSPAALGDAIGLLEDFGQQRGQRQDPGAQKAESPIS